MHDKSGVHHSHSEEHFQQSQLIRDVVIGMADGLTVPFALAAGLSGAVDSNAIVITAGIAEIAAGSIAMGLGGYLAGKTEVEHYDSELKREYHEVKHFYEKEKEEVREVFAAYGLSRNTQNIIADEMAKDEDKWVDFMMKYELGLDKPDAKRARNSALNIGVAYVVGGIVPLSAYFFTSIPHEGLIYSSGITVVCLLVFGYFKAKFTGQPPLAGALKTSVIGIVAAIAAYGIASLFS
ncbi:MAG: VIT1/CCC1 transporter family protein [Bacteroidia bacterium]